ncbi:MAG TPA: peptidoglycan bridge formation glycyltransferase FemA/FemB family protein [Baekduia sp.]|nr:peptidoglycan bridge formation glycyltransferase FemA/FemB family protein [Baekduia sp.]
MTGRWSSIPEPSVTVDERAAAPEWDAFVAASPGGHHLQTSKWGRVKAAAGLRAARVVLHDATGAPLAGAQALVRDLPVVGAVAYVPRGPLAAPGRPELAAASLDALGDWARATRVAWLKVQPPVDRGDLEAVLRERGFRPGTLQTAPAATVRVALAGRSEDELLAAMRTTTRRNIRLGQRRGVTVRPGTRADLRVVHPLLAATAVRQGFAAYGPEYWEAVWDAFAPDGELELLVAEHEGAPVGWVLVVLFGDTALFKIGAWGGGRGVPPANELLHWTAMCHARERGLAVYDLEGIPPDLARAVAAGQDIGDPGGVARFKLGFGGDVVLLPATHDRPCRPVAGRAIGLVEARSERLRPLVHRLAGRG